MCKCDTKAENTPPPGFLRLIHTPSPPVCVCVRFMLASMAHQSRGERRGAESTRPVTYGRVGVTEVVVGGANTKATPEPLTTIILHSPLSINQTLETRQRSPHAALHRIDPRTPPRSSGFIDPRAPKKNKFNCCARSAGVTLTRKASERRIFPESSRVDVAAMLM